MSGGASPGPGAAPPSAGGSDEAAWRCAGLPGGYAWWYADVSDGRYTLTVILFAGAVFSPDYAQAVRRGEAATGLQHPAVNVALFDGRRPIAWVMNEHPEGSLSPLPGGLRVAESSLRREPDGTVLLRLREDLTRFFALPGPSLTGEVRLRPGPGVTAAPGAAVALSPPGAAAPHHWQPRLLGGTAEVDLSIGRSPARSIRFRGAAYHDGNFGAGRLEQTFARWSWAHGTDAALGRAVVLYRVAWRGGGGLGLLRDEEGAIHRVPEPRRLLPSLPPAPPWLRAPGAFQVADRRCVRSEEPLLSAPFYARYRARISSSGARGGAYDGVGEYLDLQRFSSRGIQFLLRYKTRRVGMPGPLGGLGA